MSMLAENRRRSKWVINPTKKPIWSTDSSGIKFGKQLMEKMGWSAGKGLGLNEQGIQEPLKVSFKNDTKGMGFKGNDDDWIEHQDDFNVLLNQLRSKNDSSAVNGSEKKNEIKSLEERSKKSKARVHYQKFTRGKDLSKYSESDLACILGTGKTKKKDKPQTEEVTESKTKVNGDFETSFGVTTINSGSINDYFKKKWVVKPSGGASKADKELKDDENFRPSFSIGNSCLSVNDEIGVKSEEQNVSIKKPKSMPEKESLHLEEYRTPELDETENTEKTSKKKKKQKVEIDLEQEPESKKRRKNCNDSGGFENSSKEPESLSVGNENWCNATEEMELKKEKKKRKRNLEVNTNNNLEQINDTSNEVIPLEEESSKRKKKKKDKKEKEDENKVIENGYNNQSGGMDESCLEVGMMKNKKKKNQKLQNFGEIDNNAADSDATDHIKNQELEKMEKSSIVCQSENTVDVESSKKKKKKKDKKEKVEECDDTNLEVPSSDKKNSEQAGEGENKESGKKKKKKSKKEKLDDNNEIENESIQIETTTVNCEGEIVKKKKKKDKKEKFKEIECKNKESCMEERVLEECILDVESVEKKKKKKHKKEKKKDDEGTENKEEPGGEKIQKETHLNVNVNEVNGVLKGNTEGQDRLQKLRGSLFPDKAEDKYFPQRGTNERVLKLIRWANLEEFRGSNLRELEGYGRRKIHEKQSR